MSVYVFGLLGRPLDIWPEGSPERAWVTAYAEELHRFSAAAKGALCTDKLPTADNTF